MTLSPQMVIWLVCICYYIVYDDTLSGTWIPQMVARNNVQHTSVWEIMGCVPKITGYSLTAKCPDRL